MRIAQVAPLYESTPPRFYGGTERVVSYLTEELVHQGQEVTLFATGDSITSAELIAPCKKALRLDPDCKDPLAWHIILLDEVLRRSADYDVIHFHIDYMHFPFTSRAGFAHLTTLHGRLDLPELPRVYRQFPNVPLISISNAQRRPLWWANWRATIHHGLPGRLYRLNPNPGRYLAFLGRISPEKRADRAIEVAKRVGIPLRIAAKVDRVDAEYFERRIKPLLDHPLIEFIGEIRERDKQEFLGNALALLFPVDWPEPFGLVMIEAMACGTPVIAFRRGSVPEIVEEGRTGFIVSSIEEAARAIARLPSISRTDCRKSFDRRFTAFRMAEEYLTQYAEQQLHLVPRIAQVL